MRLSRHALPRAKREMAAGEASKKCRADQAERIHRSSILRDLACLRAEGVQIFIGQESGYTILDDCSVVTAPYTLDNEVVGVLGVIGPTRMAYERVIPIVDITAKLLGSALNSKG